MAFRCRSYALHVVNFINRSDMFRSVCICISLRLHASLILKRDGIVYVWSTGGTLIPRLELCCHHCPTIELHSTSSLGTTPSSITNFLTQTPSSATIAFIYSTFVVVSITMFNFGTHPNPAWNFLPAHYATLYYTHSLLEIKYLYW